MRAFFFGVNIMANNSNKTARNKNLTPFPKGVSGNPNGRPKGAKSIKTVLRELLAAKDPKGEWANPVALKLIKEAFDEGNYKAVVEIIDRIEGKSKEIKAVEVSGEIAHTVTKIDLDERVQRPETTC